MPQPLVSLVADLSENRFDILRSKYESYFKSDFQIVRQKGFYYCSYITTEQVFDEKYCRHYRNGKYIAWRWSNYQQIRLHSCASNGFKVGCQNIGDYHNNYLTCDTLLLACVFETFRDIGFDTYGLDRAQYYGASNLSWEAFLKLCKPDLNLLTGREKLDFVENMMRGRRSVFSLWAATSSSKQLPSAEL